MAEMNFEKETKGKSTGGYFASILIAQTVCVVIILLTIFVVKTFWQPLFSKIKDNYNSRFLTETSVNEVLQEDDESEVENGEV